MKKKQKHTTLILLLVFFTGLSVMLYPAISSYWNEKAQTEAIIDYEKMLMNMKPEDYTEYFEKAQAYNEELAKLPAPLANYEQVEGYWDILDLTGTGIMGYLSIDVIGVELPVYHGTSDSVLGVAVGHLQGTSFPIGGEETHSCVSAHRGLPNATLFTHLDHVELGDTFEFTILDRTITYQVDQIKIVEPHVTEDLMIAEDEQYCTLLTCTPYGINTHRLLVRGRLIDANKQKQIYVTSDAHQIDSLIVTPVVALPMLVILMFIVLMMPVKKDDLEEELEL